MDIAGAITSLKAARKARGWTAGELAARATEIAAAEGDTIQITQQTISFFERGRTKSVPRWYRFAKIALQDDPMAAEQLVSVPIDRPELRPQRVMLPVELPPEYVMAEMFRAMMLSMPDVMEGMSEKGQGVLSRELAKLLPSVLAQVKGPFSSARMPQPDDEGEHREDRDGERSERQQA